MGVSDAVRADPSFASSRKEVRRLVSHRGILVRDDGSIWNHELRDLSYSGCKIETDAPLRRNEILKLSALGFPWIGASVRWCSEGQAGLVFEDVTPEVKSLWPRRVERKQVDATVVLKRPGRPRYHTPLYDLSTNGCQLDFVDLPAMDEKVSVKLDGLELLQAEICWIRGHRAGLRFSKSLHPAVLDLFLAQL